MVKTVIALILLSVFLGASAAAQNEAGYSIKITSPSGAVGSTFEDEFIKINFSPNFNLDFTLVNKTAQAIEVDWQKASFVDPGGQTQQVIYHDLSYAQKLDAMPSSVIKPAGMLSNTIVPVGSISHESASDRWLLKGIFPGGMSLYVDKPFSLRLPIKVGAQTREYSFIFVLERGK